MKNLLVLLLLFITNISLSQDYSDSLIECRNNKIELFSTKTVERIFLSELNKDRIISNTNILKFDSFLYKSAKKHSLKMLKKNKYQHSVIPLGYIEFIGHDKIDIKEKITHRELALGALNGFLQTPQHKLVLMDPSITNIGVAVSAKLIKIDDIYYYNIYITIHTYQ